MKDDIFIIMYREMLETDMKWGIEAGKAIGRIYEDYLMISKKRKEKRNTENGKEIGRKE